VVAACRYRFAVAVGAVSPGGRSGFSVVILDFFGTVVCRPDGIAPSYAAVFERHGYRYDDQVAIEHHTKYDGVDHTEHSVDEASYERWVRSRHGELARACEVAPHEVDQVVEAMRTADESGVIAYPDAAPTLRELRVRGLRIGVCSNWGWELDRFIVDAGLAPLVDAAVTSARVGARKPHPRIYEAITRMLEVSPGEALFVGDSFGPDVEGPLAAGMRAVHLWRSDERVGNPPPRPDGLAHVSSLTELLEWPELGG